MMMHLFNDLYMHVQYAVLDQLTIGNLLFGHPMTGPMCCRVYR